VPIADIQSAYTPYIAFIQAGKFTYLRSTGAVRDSTRLCKSDELGDACMLWQRGEMCSNGFIDRGPLGTSEVVYEQNDEKAEYWFRKSAEAGDEFYQLKLAEMYKEGRSVSQDDEQAVYWYRMAAEQGNDEAQWLLGGMYEYGRGVIPDIEQAEFWYRKSAEQAGEKAQLSLDEMFDEGHGAVLDEEQATYWNIKSAEKGHVWAMRNLGVMYQNGLRVEQDDGQAAYWLNKAAYLGDAESQFYLGRMCQVGRGVEQDKGMNPQQRKIMNTQSGLSLFISLAGEKPMGKQDELTLKQVKAAFKPKQKNEQAEYWYRKAAKQGHADAQEALKTLGIDWNK